MCRMMLSDDHRTGGFLKDAIVGAFVEKAQKGDAAALSKIVTTHPVFFGTLPEPIEVPVDGYNSVPAMLALRDAKVPARAYVLTS